MIAGKVQVSDVRQVKPVFIIGAQKAGTSYLYLLLAQDCVFARAGEKECKFYSRPYFDGKDFVKKFEMGPSTRFLLDGSASYLHVTGTAGRVYSDFGDRAHVVVTMRDPIARAASGYLHEVKHGRELRRPEEVFDLHASSIEQLLAHESERLEIAHAKSLIQPHYAPEMRYRDPFFQFRYLANSAYAEQAAPWLSLFNNLYFVDFDDLRQNPSRVLHSLRSRLGLPHVEMNTDFPERNQTRVRLLRALRENRALDYDRRPSLNFVARRLVEIRIRQASVRSSIPDGVADLLRTEFDRFRRRIADRAL